MPLEAFHEAAWKKGLEILSLQIMGEGENGEFTKYIDSAKYLLGSEENKTPIPTQTPIPTPTAPAATPEKEPKSSVLWIFLGGAAVILLAVVSTFVYRKKIK